MGWNSVLSRREVPNKLSYNGVFRVDSSVWRDVMSWDGGRSGIRAVIVGFRNGNRIVRVSPDIKDSLVLFVYWISLPSTEHKCKLENAVTKGPTLLNVQFFNRR